MSDKREGRYEVHDRGKDTHTVCLMTGEKTCSVIAEIDRAAG